MNESEKKTFDFRKLFSYIGFFGALASALVYLIIVYIMVNGFKENIQNDKMIIFSLLGGAFGVVISIFLRQQGIEFAKQTPEAIKVLNSFKKETKIKRRSISRFMIISIIKDLFTKVASIAISTMFVLNVFIEGMQDDKYFGLAIANVILFISLGFLGLVKTYDVYLEEHIPYLEQKIKDAAQPSVVANDENGLEQRGHRISINDTKSEEVRGIDTQKEA